MPDRRGVKKGSFGGHIDELVKHFSESCGPAKSRPRKTVKRKRLSTAKLNQALFESATR